jgi:hypothetical protein
MSALNRTVELASGTLDVRVAHSRWPLDDLCAFAARDNPRRAFLVVSKVLGRHIPARPSTMRASFRDLTALVPDDLAGPVLVMGMAETAICLGQGVHEELLRRSGRDDLLYLHSTRQLLDHPILCRFEEPHSHASSHIVYRPETLAPPRTLIIVDDEISTGTTIVNCARAMIAQLPQIERVIAVTLADWSGGAEWLENIGRPGEIVSLLAGSLRCDSRIAPPPPAAVPGRGAGFDRAAVALGTMARHRNFGRLGRSDVADEGDPLIGRLADLPPGSALRVLGTGEFTYPAFRIAELLERQGHDVVMQSTTRSPVQPSAVIASKLSFHDNYGTDVPNFVYNVDLADRRATVICHETPPGSVDPQLVSLLGARLLAFGDL